MIFDSHLHSEFSSDSKISAKDIIATGKKMNLGLVFTEHFDAEAGGDERYFKVDATKYMSEYAKYRNDHVLLGIEIGLTDTSYNINKSLVEAHDFDFVLGSVHMIDGVDIFKDLNESKNPMITFESYLKANLDMVMQNEFFDSLGHIDYAARYSRFKESEVAYENNKQLYDDILKALIEKGKVIEINGRILKNDFSYQNLYKIYERYYNLGGRYVTLGSDAHYLENIGVNFDLAMKISNRIGLIPVYFRNRKMEICKD